jgi:hypothetical protein
MAYKHTFWICATTNHRRSVAASAAGDAAFGAARVGQDRPALAASPAARKIDGLHLAGNGSVPSSMLPDHLMAATLELGVQRTAAEAPWSPGYAGTATAALGPSPEQVAADQAFASLATLETMPVSVGEANLPA